MSTWARRVRVLGISVVANLTLAISASAVIVFNVDSTLDQIDDDTSDGVCHTAANTCTLRAAVMQANPVISVGATVVLPAGTYTLTLPATGADGSDSGDLNFTPPASGNPILSIVGAGQSSTIVGGNLQSRIFRVHPGRTATLSLLTVRNGYVPGATDGGGIRNSKVSPWGSWACGNRVRRASWIGGFEGPSVRRRSPRTRLPPKRDNISCSLWIWSTSRR